MTTDLGLGWLFQCIHALLLEYKKSIYKSLLFRPGSVGVTANLIFQNESVVPSITSASDSLETSLNDSLVFLNVISGSIVAGL